MDISRPQPPPQISTSPQTSSFPRQAANFSLFAPLVVLGISIWGQPQVRGVRWAMLVLSLTSILTILVGFVLGITALIATKRHGRQGIFGRALAGTCICGLLMLFMFIMFPMGLRAMKGAKEIQQQRMEQKDHLFSLSPPPGWQWYEQSGKVRILDPRSGNAISIQFGPAGNYSSDEVKELLKIGNQTMIESSVKPSGGTVLKEEERQLGGVYARQLTFLQSDNGQTGTVTYISLITKNNAFTVVFGGPDKNQVVEMRTSVETLRFD